MVWDKLVEAEERMNNGESVIEKLNAMEAILSLCRHWFDMVRYYLDDEEEAMIEKIFKNIHDVTNGMELSVLQASSDDNTCIRENLTKIRSQLWYFAGKYGMTPSKRDTSGNTIW